ncbi:MAG: hypothetical protein CVU63_06815 [Deltaproteobacteria bacterium HGW-Deltaproteobacteria-20]|jgi:hypothetical protein|nr:MAG: hypothetical protein CVU63_06815 [Deltaproteobacteria bacterium HGW-Deltaproteobacteria-20]
MAKPPFVPWPAQPFLRRWEGKATELRRRLSLADDGPLDPFSLVERIEGVHAVSVTDLPNVTPTQLGALHRHADEWWALAYKEADGPWLILYHPWQSQARLRVTILEEIAHIHLGHKPSRVFADPATGLPRRTYGKSKEKEAYGVAAAALVPFVGMVRKLAAGASIDDVAKAYGASRALVQYRANITRAGSAATRLKV